MRSPFTGKEMRIVRENTILPYRKDEFEIVYQAYECDDTKERFTDDELDMININQVHNQYREKYGIPFPEEIKNIREKYDVSAKKMSEILGLGSNAYRLYESGEMPSVSIGRLILSIQEADEFKRQIEFSAHLLKQTEYNRLIKNIYQIIDNDKDLWRKIVEEEYAYKTIDQNSGFKLLDLDKIANALSYFGCAKIDLFKTKVNKLLFYSDFLNYQRFGSSIFGITYKAIPFGPVPVEYEKIFKHLYDDASIDIEQFQIDHNYAEKFIPHLKFNKDLFNNVELKVLEDVASAFKNKNTTEIVNISHLEPAWIDNKDTRSIISYKKYAFDLKAIR
ncbi:type II toxin-antitoxin system antitoxin SocA domain-containing protein [Flavobacterium sp. 245]|uniref:type II toxin-antitoxin system antitoxin SocA domain-containing protein n=1 Tax=Flavobacterium sp. 245 TaxID=2512115 RepID=UPI00105F363F|nr:type II toxin-antitoxin system antitoxin SocA domain-containing protein [Flavobacterium sp. 245]TDO96068.1 putative zinc finger/helix-turn-helix YgiT family protein [Flavobacterium sp. 245]